MAIKLTTLGLLASLTLASTAHAISVTAENNGELLAQSILGSGVSIDNVNYIGVNGQAGTFTDGLVSGLGMDQGVILSTGLAANIQGNNTQGDTSYETSSGAHAGLANLSGGDVFDQNVLSFDFTIDANQATDLYFNMVFGSEEYPEFVNQFNDVFAVYLDGVNVATLAGTDTAISINNVNAKKNSEFYVDNADKNYALQANGFTTNLEIAMFDLFAGTHSIEFAIVDAVDHQYDSWLLIEMGSFTTKPVDVPAPAGLLLFGLAIAGMGVKRKRVTK